MKKTRKNSANLERWIISVISISNVLNDDLVKSMQCKTPHQCYYNYFISKPKKIKAYLYLIKYFLTYTKPFTTFWANTEPLKYH